MTKVAIAYRLFELSKSGYAVLEHIVKKVNKQFVATPLLSIRQTEHFVGFTLPSYVRQIP
jgi:hypothetical protein